MVHQSIENPSRQVRWIVFTMPDRGEPSTANRPHHRLQSNSGWWREMPGQVIGRVQGGAVRIEGRKLAPATNQLSIPELRSTESALITTGPDDAGDRAVMCVNISSQFDARRKPPALDFAVRTEPEVPTRE